MKKIIVVVFVLMLPACDDTSKKQSVVFNPEPDIQTQTFLTEEVEIAEVTERDCDETDDIASNQQGSRIEF